MWEPQEGWWLSCRHSPAARVLDGGARQGGREALILDSRGLSLLLLQPRGVGMIPSAWWEALASPSLFFQG